MRYALYLRTVGMIRHYTHTTGKHLTPRITREPERLNLKDSLSASRVHPLVRPPRSDAATSPSLAASRSGGSNARIQRRAAQTTFDEGHAERRVRCNELLGRIVVTHLKNLPEN